MTQDTVTAAESSYGAQDITILEGLEAVRTRPGMYIGSTGPTGLHHLVWEVVDNSVDEAMAGHCTRIDVTLTAEGACEVSDNGRGIPVENHPNYTDLTAAEVVMTVLHAGAKFGGDGYKVSGGLHGVGVSVVNALSSRVEVEIDRHGERYAMLFCNGGELIQRLKPVGTSDVVELSDGRTRPRTGTTVRFWPDQEIFDEIEFRFQTLLERFQMMAFLNRGLEIRVRDQRKNTANDNWVSFQYDGGIIDFVSHINASKEALFDTVGYFVGAEDIAGNPHEVEIAFQWNTGFNADGIHSFANGIATIEGGMHEQGFRSAVTRTVNSYARSKGLLKDKDDNLTGEDIREGLTAIISARIGEPQFEGQTKSKLGNVSMRSLVERVTNERMADWLEEHPGEAKATITKATNAARARVAASDARKAIRSKSLLDGAGMPDKLKDCSAKDPAARELFIVEGDSAGGSAVRARDPRTQAILPIRGKILNVERARIDKMLRNAEVKTLITAIGAGFADEFDIEAARYHKIILLADADVDGSHIRTLLLTFFFRQMRPLVEAGYVYIAQPPLYSTKVSNTQTVYLKDDTAKDEFLAGRPNYTKDFQRLKGLGEMDWDELRSTTMDSASRSLLQVSVEQVAIADDVTSVLMGDDVEQRKNFIVTNAREVRNLDF
ncbi:MAG: DNA topoisomerase subunit B [Acidimicrobiaceae bacterium]|nr:type IIA DNA topoisomerase subunit B [Acidimicrobiia bacterium]MCY4492497.1 DNA topoisomerase subunit B [Acidimicrobiaceae bacterium]